MFGLGSQELLIILTICFLLFGAKKIPELGRGLGKGIREFKDGLREVGNSTEEDEPEKIENLNKAEDAKS
jgi:sec-independent protein translocase protein TatA